MKVTMSPFLQNKKNSIKKLVELLSKEYGYVSVLGSDSHGNEYRVNKTGISVNDSTWTERGFVVRVHNGVNYSEFSFNQISEDSLYSISEEIALSLNPTVEKLKENKVQLNSYPILKEEKIKTSFLGEVEILPDSVTAETKLKRLTAMKDAALAHSELLVDFRVKYEEVQVSKIFISTEKDLEQSYIWSEGALISIARKENNTKYVYESFSGLKAVELLDEMFCKVETLVDKNILLLSSKPSIPGEYEVICNSEVSGLIAHEAFGHGVEMDMFVKNRAKAVEYLDKEVASSLVTMRDGAKSARHISSYLFDDEGTLGTDTIIIDKGILKQGISDVLSALKLGTIPTGNGKRHSFERKAYARMTNTFFTPGKDKVSDMITSIEHGYLLEDSMSGMEDPKNWGIQCMLLQGREIIKGKFTGNIISPVILTGYVPDLLKSITMVSEDVELGGSGACGKGYKEWVKVSSGGPYIKAKVRLG
jgi:TldD protein